MMVCVVITLTAPCLVRVHEGTDGDVDSVYSTLVHWNNHTVWTTPAEMSTRALLRHHLDVCRGQSDMFSVSQNPPPGLPCRSPIIWVFERRRLLTESQGKLLLPHKNSRGSFPRSRVTCLGSLPSLWRAISWPLFFLGTRRENLTRSASQLLQSMVKYNCDKPPPLPQTIPWYQGENQSPIPCGHVPSVSLCHWSVLRGWWRARPHFQTLSSAWDEASARAEVFGGIRFSSNHRKFA